MKSFFFVLFVLASVMAASKVEVKALVESYCPDCISFTSNELLKLTETADIMEVTDLEIVPYGKASIVSRDPPTFKCQHGDKECYGNKVELCALKHSPLKGLEMMNCLQSLYNFDDDAIKKCSEQSKVDPEPIIECAKGDEGNTLMLHAGEITPKLTYVPSVMINGELHTDAENVMKLVCDAVEGEKPKSCKKFYRCMNN